MVEKKSSFWPPWPRCFVFVLAGRMSRGKHQGVVSPREKTSFVQVWSTPAPHQNSGSGFVDLRLLFAQSLHPLWILRSGNSGSLTQLLQETYHLILRFTLHKLLVKIPDNNWPFAFLTKCQALKWNFSAKDVEVRWFWSHSWAVASEEVYHLSHTLHLTSHWPFHFWLEAVKWIWFLFLDIRKANYTGVAAFRGIPKPMAPAVAAEINTPFPASTVSSKKCLTRLDSCWRPGEWGKIKTVRWCQRGEPGEDNPKALNVCGTCKNKECLLGRKTRKNRIHSRGMSGKTHRLLTKHCQIVPQDLHNSK